MFKVSLSERSFNTCPPSFIKRINFVFIFLGRRTRSGRKSTGPASVATPSKRATRKSSRKGQAADSETDGEQVMFFSI